jgi:hypothetical protein
MSRKSFGWSSQEGASSPVRFGGVEFWEESTAESTLSAIDCLGAVSEGAVEVAADLERLLDRDLQPCPD